MNYTHLTIEERCCLREYYLKGYSYRKIAKLIGRNVSTVSRELKRNRTHMYDIPTYYPYTAQKKYLLRRSYCHRGMFQDPAKLEYTKEKLLLTWSPEQISNTPCELNMPSVRTIYRWIYEKYIDVNLKVLRRKGKSRGKKETRGKFNLGKSIRKRDKRFCYVNLSRNFGKEIAMMAGIDYAKRDAVIFIDADLQDPPELIPELIKYWEEGYDDVYAKRKTRDGETFFKKTTSKMYYKILQKLTKAEIQQDTGDFRLLDRRCVNALKKLRESQRCSKSMFSWIGYNKKEDVEKAKPKTQSVSESLQDTKQTGPAWLVRGAISDDIISNMIIPGKSKIEALDLFSKVFSDESSHIVSWDEPISDIQEWKQANSDLNYAVLIKKA